MSIYPQVEFLHLLQLAAREMEINRASLGSRRSAPRSQQWVPHRTDNIIIFCIIWRIGCEERERETARWLQPSACMNNSRFGHGHCLYLLCEPTRSRMAEPANGPEVTALADTLYRYTDIDAWNCRWKVRCISWWRLMLILCTAQQMPTSLDESNWGIRVSRCETFTNQNPPLSVSLRECIEFIETRSWVMRSDLLLHPRLMMRRQV